eukprot:scaffold2141_cov282-Pinguiococcus_pyrenoidosus.AAC.30
MATCPFCNRRLRSADRGFVEHHLKQCRSRVNALPETQTCPVCSKTFSNISVFRFNRHVENCVERETGGLEAAPKRRALKLCAADEDASSGVRPAERSKSPARDSRVPRKRRKVSPVASGRRPSHETAKRTEETGGAMSGMERGPSSANDASCARVWREWTAVRAKTDEELRKACLQYLLEIADREA